MRRRPPRATRTAHSFPTRRSSDLLDLQRVLLEGMILKPNMVISGKKCATQADRAAVAAATVRTLKRHVPGAVPGIAFLSGGQSDEDATAHLDRKSTRLNYSH